MRILIIALVLLNTVFNLYGYNYQDGYNPYVTPYLKGYPYDEDYTYYDSRNLRESWNNTNSNAPPDGDYYDSRNLRESWNNTNANGPPY